MIDLHTLAGGAVAVLGLGLGIRAVGWFLPGFLTKKVHALYEAAKMSPWWHDPAHPKRARWLLATAELLEDEIPEPGQGKAVYAQLGADIAGLSPILAGTARTWAGALEKVGDALDTELDAAIKGIASGETHA